MAFQPIVDIENHSVWGYEALVRGSNGEGAGEVLSRVTDRTKYRFDQQCRVKAIELAASLMPRTNQFLSINFMPNAVYEPRACIRTTLAAAEKTGFSPNRINFEFTESEEISDPAHLQGIIAEYRRQGFLTAIDDFGAGFAGLNFFANFAPNIVKIDMELIRDINTIRTKRAIVRGIVSICQDLDIEVLAEGIETPQELEVLKGMGIKLMQGYYFAKPEVGSLPPVSFASTNIGSGHPPTAGGSTMHALHAPVG
ncbi:EAL domain-containing protein [Roseibium hamelinense]|nr:EAL domain-containing protein [Roseibium hamelinense]